ncbi:helix-turn-helix domain-containing protein [Acidithiobacillus caldus]|uniref:helix-turn-helix domain-containing protein n=1 Tax=Acidithiobacillus caldus TaxID=33059 RepID=UPI0034A2BF1D
MDNRELVQKARERGNFQNLASLAKAVGVNHSSLSLLASGKGELSDETYARLAELAGIDPALVIIEKHERKAGVEGRKVWERLRHALVKSGSVLIVVTVPAITALHHEDLATGQTAIQCSSNRYYATYKYTRFPEPSPRLAVGLVGLLYRPLVVRAAR